jgi:hypothetical protein
MVAQLLESVKIYIKNASLIAFYLNVALWSSLNARSSEGSALGLV